MKTNQPTNDMDEATAERIASWVLGEASPMEAKQLEALCEEQALWRDYAKKLRAIHRLLDADAKEALDDHQWKMAAEKRDTVFAAITQANPANKGKKPNSWIALARVACLVIFASLAVAYINHSTADKHRQMALLDPPKALAEDPPFFKAEIDQKAKKSETGNDEVAVQSMESQSINEAPMIAGAANPGLRAFSPTASAREDTDYREYQQKSEFAPLPSFDATSSMRSEASSVAAVATAAWSSQRAPDDSFQEAFAAFQKGQRLPPQAIRVEDFYNAFDYGDPAPSTSEPIAFFSEQAVNPLQPQQLWLRISLQTASFGRDAQQSLHLTFVIDQSAVLAGKEQREVLADAMYELGKLLTERDRVSVIGFAASARSSSSSAG
jgi:hypothetical protein